MVEKVNSKLLLYMMNKILDNLYLIIIFINIKNILFVVVKKFMKLYLIHNLDIILIISMKMK